MSLGPDEKPDAVDTGATFSGGADDKPVRAASVVAKTQPAAANARERPKAVPLWLQRLLSRSDLEASRNRS